MRIFAFIQDNEFFANIMRAWRICTWLEDVNVFVNGASTLPSASAVQKLQSQLKLHVLPFAILEEDTGKWHMESVQHLLSSPLLSQTGIVS